MSEIPNTEPKVEVIPQAEVEASQKGYRNGYNQGLNDAWELLGKLYDFTCDEILNIFDLKNGFYDVIRNYTAQEALAKLKAYEDSKIKVGDVVAWTDFADDTFNGVVLDFKDNTDNEVVVFNENGGVDVWKIAECKKTGKHIEIQQILEQIGE